MARNRGGAGGSRIVVGPVASGSSAHVLLLLPNTRAPWPEGTLVRLYGGVAGVRALLQEVELAENPSSHGATEQAQGFELASYGGAPFDYYECEVFVPRPTREGGLGRTPIATFWLRSGDSESAGSRDAVGFSRLVTGQLTMVPPMLGAVRLVEANPYRRRVVLQAIGPIGSAPIFVGSDQVNVPSDGLAVIVNGPPVELRNTRGLFAFNSDGANTSILTWAAESA
jgi:hypothetical protein